MRRGARFVEGRWSRTAPGTRAADGRDVLSRPLGSRSEQSTGRASGTEIKIC